MLKTFFTSLLISLGIVQPTPLPIPSIQLPLIEQSPIQVDEIPNSIGGDLSNELGGGEDVIETPVIATSSGCSCIAWARVNSSIQPPKVVAAKDIPITHFAPRIGSWVIFKAVPPYGQYGHAGIVRQVHPLSFEVEEFNLKPCEKTHRIIMNNDPVIKGFFDNRQS